MVVLSRGFLHKYIGGLIVTLAALIFFAGSIYVYDFYIDDMYISLRYAQNLVHFGQLSFNIGNPPVEAYTNFLFILLEGMLIKFGLTIIDIPKIIGIFSGILSIILIYKLAYKILPPEAVWMRYLPVLSLSVNSTMIVWAVGGLETDLFLLLILGGINWFILNMESKSFKDALISDLFFFLAFLTRPDGILVWFLSYLFLLCFFKKVDWKNRIYSMGVSAFLVGVYLAWKYSYFGGIIPSTFYSKINKPLSELFQEGIGQYLHFLVMHLHYIFFLLMFLPVWKMRRKIYNPIIYLFFLFVGYSSYVIYLGSPAMNHAFRFHITLIPLLYLLGSYGFWIILSFKERLSSTVKKAAIIVILMLQIGVGGYQLYTYYEVNFNWYYDFEGRFINMKELSQITTKNFEIANWIHENFPPQTVVAAGDIGVVGYFSNAKIIDTWSLMDKNIIEMRKEQAQYPVGSQEYIGIDKYKIAKYILDQNPALILLDYVDYSADPRAQNYIRLESISNDEKHLFIREDLLDSPPGPKAERLTKFTKDWMYTEGAN